MFPSLFNYMPSLIIPSNTISNVRNKATLRRNPCLCTPNNPCNLSISSPRAEFAEVYSCVLLQISFVLCGGLLLPPQAFPLNPMWNSPVCILRKQLTVFQAMTCAFSSSPDKNRVCQLMPQSTDPSARTVWLSTPQELEANWHKNKRPRCTRILVGGKRALKSIVNQASRSRYWCGTCFVFKLCFILSPWHGGKQAEMLNKKTVTHSPWFLVWSVKSINPCLCKNSKTKSWTSSTVQWGCLWLVEHIFPQKEMAMKNTWEAFSPRSIMWENSCIILQGTMI